jgi:hypothetical protein
MKKESLICFRASKELHESLSQAAKEDRRSLSSMIETILTSYLKEKKEFQGVEKEKRQFQRKDLSVPAVIHQQEPGQIGIGAITEISLGGVRVLIPKDFEHKILIDAKGSKFEIVFNLPTKSKPLRMSCESMRVEDAEDSIQVGASFVDGDFKSYKTLQTYLM